MHGFYKDPQLAGPKQRTRMLSDLALSTVAPIAGPNRECAGRSRARQRRA
jgi:hypothetical protein